MFYRTFIFIFSLLMGGLMWANNIEPANASDINQNGILNAVISPEVTVARVDFAKFLTKNDVVLYTVWYCSHCHNQKDLFGQEALKELTTIECAEEGDYTFSKVCKDKEITGTPSWEINNQIIAGTTSLNDLAKLTNYNGNTNF